MESMRIRSNDIQDFLFYDGKKPVQTLTLTKYVSTNMAVMPDEHVEDDVARDDVGVVEAAAHVVERRRQVLPRVRLAQLPQVRQELLLHVNPESTQ